jgi:hypothetical protein
MKFAKGVSMQRLQIGESTESGGNLKPVVVLKRHHFINPGRSITGALIKSWQFHAESHHPSTKRRPPSSADDWIFAIENLSARQMVVAIKSDLARAIDEVKLLRKLLPNGGVLEVAQPSAMQAPTDKSSVVVTALAERSCKRFVDGPLHNPAQLPEMGLRLTKKGDLVSESTGEVILEAVAIDLLRAAAKLR